MLGNLLRLLEGRFASELDAVLRSLRGSLSRLESNVGTLGKTIFVFQLLIRLSLSVRRLRRTKVPALVVRPLGLVKLVSFLYDLLDVLDSASYDVDFTSVLLFVR